MKTRPWPIVLLALAHFLAPIGNLWINSLLLKEGLIRYSLGQIHAGGFIALFQFFFAYPLAGLAIYMCRKWSFAVFAGAWALGMYFDVKTWLAVPQLYPLWLFMATSAIDLMLVGYFLHPAVRAPFLNPALRWWESKPRYRINHWAQLVENGQRADCLIMDVSEGGVFIKASEKTLSVGESVKLAFPFFRESFVFSGTVVHQRRHAHPGYGIRFSHTQESRKKVRRVIGALKSFRAKSRDNFSRAQDFTHWAKGLTKGRGWFPEWHNSPRRASVTNMRRNEEQNASTQKAA